METYRALYIHSLEFLSGREKLFLWESEIALDQLDRLGSQGIRELFGKKPRPSSWKPEEIRRRVEKELRTKEVLGLGLRGLWQVDYPLLLREIYDPPFVLWYQGNFPEKSLGLVSVVGTRRPSEEGRYAAYSLGRDSARLGVGLVSGLAFGIDGAAHAGCADDRGYTLAVLASGLDEVQPRAHGRLARHLLDAGGCLLSEVGPGTAARKYQFPRRNRIISGLSAVLIVVEAPEKSGALISVDFSLDEGREVFVHTAGLKSPVSQGTRNLVNQGAGIISCLDELKDYAGKTY